MTSARSRAVDCDLTEERPIRSYVWRLTSHAALLDVGPPAVEIDDEAAAPATILIKPQGPPLLIAHGAGAGMSHPFMEQVAAGLYTRGKGC